MTMASRTTKTKNDRTRTAEQAVTPSSGNVFADLGLPDADELLAKADLVHAIQQLVNGKKLSQRTAAMLLGVAQPDLSKLFRGRLEGFSIERLVRMLNALDQDVRIVVQPKPPSHRRGTVRTLLRKTA
jgi:predicted XRE-type DNA-binding protein